MKNKKKVKKSLKVNKSFMTDYLKYLFLLSFAVICAIFLAHHTSLTQMKATILANPGDTQLHVQVLEAQSLIFYKLMVATMVCFFIAVCALTNVLTQRVSKPVEEFINHLSSIPHLSQARKMRLKKGETFQELGKTFNFLLQKQELQADKIPVHNYRSVLK